MILFGKITAEKIGKWKESKDIKQLTGALCGEDENIGIMAASALIELGSNDLAAGLLDMLHSPKPSSRIEGARGLSRLKPPGIAEAISSAMDDQQPDVLAILIRAIGTHANEKTCRQLAGFLSSTNTAVAAAAEDMLILNGQTFAPMLTALYTEQNNVQSKAALARIIGKLRIVSATDALIHGMSDQRKEIADAAEQALINIGKPAMEKIVTLLKQPEMETRACRILTVSGDITCIDSLLQVIQTSPRKESVSAAICALGNMASNKTTDTLIAVLQSDKYNDTKPGDPSQQEQVNNDNHWNHEIRKNAITALGNAGATQSADAIIKSLKNAYTREAAIHALIKFGEPAIMKALDKDEWFADDVCNALRKIKSPESGSLIKLIEEWKKSR